MVSRDVFIGDYQQVRAALDEMIQELNALRTGNCRLKMENSRLQSEHYKDTE